MPLLDVPALLKAIRSGRRRLASVRQLRALRELLPLSRVPRL
jgi:hypothetical protein